MSRPLLFFRDFQYMTGGHLKVWHYFRHALSSPEFLPRIYFTPESRLDETNPWIRGGVRPEDGWNPEQADLLFVGGMDWEWIETHPKGTAGRAVLNIIQGLRHADPSDPRHTYLDRQAIRLVVSPPIEQALRSIPRVRGPVVQIPMGLDLEVRTHAGGAGEQVVIAAIKNVPVGQQLADRLASIGVTVRLLDAPLPRDAYLQAVATARVLVCLPTPSEGFYLPALEAMALGRIVVCPDCGGNRTYFLHGHNGVSCTLTPDSIMAATLHALALDPETESRMRNEALATAARYPLSHERSAFLEVLARADRLWQQMR
jgi:hypothetical protein